MRLHLTTVIAWWAVGACLWSAFYDLSMYGVHRDAVGFLLVSILALFALLYHWVDSE